MRTYPISRATELLQTESYFEFWGHSDKDLFFLSYVFLQWCCENRFEFQESSDLSPVVNKLGRFVCVSPPPSSPLKIIMR